MYTPTKTHVRSEFTYIRQLMQKANEAMRISNDPMRWSKADAMQIAMELEAAASIFTQWVDSQ